MRLENARRAAAAEVAAARHSIGQLQAQLVDGAALQAAAEERLERQLEERRLEHEAIEARLECELRERCEAAAAAAASAVQQAAAEAAALAAAAGPSRSCSLGAVPRHSRARWPSSSQQHAWGWWWCGVCILAAPIAAVASATSLHRGRRADCGGLAERRA